MFNVPLFSFSSVFCLQVFCLPQIPPCHLSNPWHFDFDPASGGVPASTGCSMRWLHVEVDRLASLKSRSKQTNADSNELALAA